MAGSTLQPSPQWAYHNGEFVSEHELCLGLHDLGVLQSVTCVERLRTYGGRVFLPQRHFDRLHRSVDGLRISAAAEVSKARSALQELLERNGECLEATGDTNIVVLVTPGVAGREQPTIIVHLVHLDQQRIDRLHTEGERLVISTVRQPSPETIPRFIKTRYRAHYYLADQLAQCQSPGAAAVLIDEDGSLTETSRANLLVTLDRQIISPPFDRILPGITLSVIREIAADRGIPFVEQPITRRMFEDADEILLTGTGPAIWHGNDRHGEILQLLRSEFNERLKFDASYQ